MRGPRHLHLHEKLLLWRRGSASIILVVNTRFKSEQLVSSAIKSVKVKRRTKINRFKDVLHYDLLSSVCVLLTSCKDVSAVAALFVLKVTSRDGCWSIALKLVEIYSLFYSFVCRFIFCTQAVNVLIQDYNTNSEIHHHSGGNGLSLLICCYLIFWKEFPAEKGVATTIAPSYGNFAYTSIARQ